MIVAGTGHRPPRLGLDYSVKSRQLLRDFARMQLAKMASLQKLISGGAQGWDQALAEAALSLNIPVLVALPFAGQEAKWPLEAQERYRELLSRCQVVVVSEGGYANSKFYKRDQYMVDHAQHVLALLDDKPEKSGTRITVQYAHTLKKPVTNVWSEWVSFLG